MTTRTVRTRTAIAVVWLLLGATRLITLLLPFSVVRRLLGEHLTGPADPPPPSADPADPADQARARRIGHLVRATARRTPWRSDCYPQALTARALLRARRIPHAVTFGVRRDERGELRAHAWVTAGPTMVTGGTTEAWAAVGTFAWMPRASRRR